MSVPEPRIIGVSWEALRKALQIPYDPAFDLSGNVVPIIDLTRFLSLPAPLSALLGPGDVVGVNPDTGDYYIATGFDQTAGGGASTWTQGPRITVRATAQLGGVPSIDLVAFDITILVAASFVRVGNLRAAALVANINPVNQRTQSPAGVTLTGTSGTSATSSSNQFVQDYAQIAIGQTLHYGPPQPAIPLLAPFAVGDGWQIEAQDAAGTHRIVGSMVVRVRGATGLT